MTEEQIVLKQPTKARASNKYLVVIEDADGVEHFWNKDGSYDGWGKPLKEEIKNENKD